MTRYMCPSCHEVVETVPVRFAFCPGCGGPLTIHDVLPVLPIARREQPDLSQVSERAS
jgi:hypothetical protein